MSPGDRLGHPLQRPPALSYGFPEIKNGWADKTVFFRIDRVLFFVLINALERASIDYKCGSSSR
jgi:hypothetical protein